MRKLFKENALEAFRIYLKRLDVKFSEHTIRWLGSHPEFPNLFSISHALNKLGVLHMAIKPSYTELQNDLPKPVLVHIYDNGGMYLVIDHADSENVYFVNEDDQLEAELKEDFLRSWSGVAMIAFNDNHAKEENIRINRIKDTLISLRFPAILAGLAIIIIQSIFTRYQSISTFDWLFILSKTFGIAISVLLMIQYFDKNNPLIKKICTSGKSNFNCNDILHSNAANLFGLISWSEIGLIYFSSLLIFLLVPIQHSAVVISSGIGIMAAPYTIYSIFYQWKVAQAWCKLCLLIQLALLCDLIIGVFFFSIHNTILYPALSDYTLLVGIVFLNIGIYAVIKPMISNSQNFNKQIKILNKIKFDKEIFTTLLQRSPFIDTSAVHPVALGKKDAEVKITIISNPVCKPCIEAHEKLFKLLKSKQNLTIYEIFFTESDKNDPSFQTAELMLRLHNSLGTEALIDIYQEYYSYPLKKSVWVEQNGISSMDESSTAQLISHIEWCHQHRFKSTPLILFNNHLLPESYSVDDLEYLID